MRRLVSVLVLALVAAACGGDDTDDAGADPTTTAAEPAEAVEAGDDTEVESDAGDGPADTTTTTSTVPTQDPAQQAPSDGASPDEGRDESLVLVSDLSAGEAVPPPGDEGGTGRVEIQSSGSGTLCFDMVARGLQSGVVASHVHRGARGASGDVVIDIGLPTAVDGDTDIWRDVCVEVDPGVADGVESDPEGHYVNVHTETYPESALRGQLQRASIFDLVLS